MENKDIQKFERDGFESKGCDTGDHDYDTSNGNLSVGDDGLTNLTLKCIHCGVVNTMASELKINDLLEGGTPKEQPKEQSYQQVVTQTPVIHEKITNPESSDVLKRLFGN